MEQNDLIKGALIGVAIGGLAALFMAPKSGKQLRDDIVDGYNSFSTGSHDKLDDVKEKAQCFMDSLQGKACEEPCETNVFLLGGLAGTVLGGLAGLLLAPQAGNKLREKLGDEYDVIYDKAKGVMNSIQSGKNSFQHEIEDWKDVFSDIVGKLSKTSKKKGSNGSSYLNDISDWASLGLRLYHEVQNRR